MTKEKGEIRGGKKERKKEKRKGRKEGESRKKV